MSDIASVHLALSEGVERLQTLTVDAALLADLVAIAAAFRSEALCNAERLAGLVRDFDLTPFEQDIVILTGLPEEHESISHLVRHLNPSSEPAMSFGIIAHALGLDWTGRSFLRAAIESGPLRRAGLVVGNAEVPLPDRGLRLPTGLWSTIRGSDGWPEELQPADIVPHQDLVAGPIETALSQSDTALLVVAGGADRSASELAGLVAAVLERRGDPWVGIPAGSLDAARSRLWSTHCVVRDVSPIVIGDAAEDLLRTFPGRIIACLTGNGRLPDDPRAMRRVHIGRRDLGESVRLWERLAPELNGEAVRLAGLLRVDHLHATRAVNDTRSLSTNPQLTAGAIVTSVRTRSGAKLPSSARLVTPVASMSQLVLPPKERDQIGAVLDRLQQQVSVLQDWGFEGVRGRRGVRLLLSGPPGTGKTLAVEALAAELGLDLMVVDLSALVSKWLGETEKNIAEVFDAAEQQQAVLFFDEADAIFGRRTSGGDANDRWANLETAYLLGRIDAFEGLVALATNLRSNIDEAFFRRLDVLIQLSDPGYEERVELWRRHMPIDADYSADVQCEQLASIYPITGGQIRNASLSAAFVASAQNVPISQRILVDAVRIEYEKSGRSFPGLPPGFDIAQGTPGALPRPNRFDTSVSGVATVRRLKETT